MGYLGTKPANAVLTSEQIADGAIVQADLASNVVGNGPVFSVYLNGTQTISVEFNCTLPGQHITLVDSSSSSECIDINETGLVTKVFSNKYVQPGVPIYITISDGLC